MKLSTVLIFILGLAAGGAGIFFWKQSREADPPSIFRPTQAKPNRAASALGRIQPFHGILTLGVSLPDRLEKLRVEEGDDVKEGAVLAELETRKDRQIDLELLDFQIKQAQERIKELKHTGDLQIELDRLTAKQVEEVGPLEVSMQKLKVEFLKKQAAQALEGRARIQSLVSVSQQEKDQQEMLVLQSEAELAGAEKLLQKMSLGQELNLKQAQAKIELSNASLERTVREVPLESLKQQRAMALRRLEYTQLNAPNNGKILRIMVRPGELVGAPQPILQMADLSKMAVMAEVYETDIGKIFEGQEAQILSRVESSRMMGKVVLIGIMLGKNRVFDADPLADQDRRVFEVKILLDQPKQAEKLINHQVTVEFQPRQ